MRIFISWSGVTSKKLAEVIRQWIPGVIQAARPYYSPDDISKGSRWGSEISKELDSSRIGIICLTKDNLQAPWIMFEAGALSKNIEISKVCPILFGIEPSDIQGPLVQFQAAKFSKEEIKKVIRMINSELGDNSLAPDVLDNVFEMWWPKLKESVEIILNDDLTGNDLNLRSERELLEEVLELTRAAYINKERALDRQRAINPEAIYDLCYGFLKVTKEVQSFVDAPSLYDLIEQLFNLSKPLKYVVTRISASAENREKLMSVLSGGEMLIRRAQRNSSRNFQKEIEIDFSEDDNKKEDDEKE